MAFDLSEWPLCLQEESTRGRFLTSSRKILCGEVVLRDHAHAHGWEDPFKLKTCSHCFAFKYRGRGDFVVCQNCRTTAYCSTACQEADFAHPGLECQVLKMISASKKEVADMDISLIRLALRLVARALTETSTEPFARVWALVSNRSSFPSSEIADFSKIQSFLVRCFRKAHAIERVAELAASVGCSLDDFIIELLCRHHNNNFGVWNKESDFLGHAMFLTASLFNHSCLPTVSALQEGPNLIFRALRDIEPGEEMCIRYIDTDVPTEQRKQKLSESYFFDCNCSMCAGAECGKPFLERHTCPESCSGILVPVRESLNMECNLCGFVVGWKE